MTDQQFNVKFVEEIEKHDVLYNYRLPGYSKKSEVDNAWSEVSAQVNLPVHECKERWKNLRTVFMRKMKTHASGNGGRKKAYYLENAMQFCLPFIKAGALLSSGNYPPVPVPSTTVEILTENTQTSGSSASLMDMSGSLPTVHSQVEPTSEPVQNTIPNKQTNLNQPSTSKKTKYSLADTDKFVAEYFKAKKAKLNSLNVEDKTIHRQQANKMFLLSLLPEIEELSDYKIKMFKRRVFTIIDELSTSSHYQQHYDEEPHHKYAINQVILPESESPSTTGTTEFLE